MPAVNGNDSSLGGISAIVSPSFEDGGECILMIIPNQLPLLQRSDHTPRVDRSDTGKRRRQPNILDHRRHPRRQNQIDHRTSGRLKREENRPAAESTTRQGASNRASRLLARMLPTDWRGERRAQQQIRWRRDVTPSYLQRRRPVVDDAQRLAAGSPCRAVRGGGGGAQK